VAIDAGGPGSDDGAPPRGIQDDDNDMHPEFAEPPGDPVAAIPGPR